MQGLTLDIAHQNQAWAKALPDSEALIERTLQAALDELGPLDDPSELSLVLADNRFIQTLNKDWRGQDKPTNVLSFPASERVPSKPVPSKPVPSKPVPSKPVPSKPVPSKQVPGKPVAAGQLVGDAAVPLGDIVLALETISAEAQGQGKSLEHHLSHLLIHGLLHLLGYDHDDETRAGQMESLETRILARLGINDPY